MRYVNARLEDFEREEAYRIYVTKSLQLNPQGNYLTSSFYDIIHGETEIDDRDGDEIAADIITRAGLRFES